MVQANESTRDACDSSFMAVPRGDLMQVDAAGKIEDQFSACLYFRPQVDDGHWAGPDR
jgi:hypothetical protein